jgi:hypothetical protein
MYNRVYRYKLALKKGVNFNMEAYCVKCKAKHMMVDPQPVVMKNGKPATTGTCSACGTKMFKIGAAPK